MNKLPPGVEALTLPPVFVSADRPAWTEEQMRAAHAAGARAGFLAGLEAAAKVCDEKAKRNFPWASENSDRYHAQADWAAHCAKAIRILKEQQ